MKNTVQAFAGEANFGLSTFAVLQNNCSAGCYTNCQYFCFQAEINTRGVCTGCGPRPGNATTSAGAMIRVPLLQDNHWTTPPPATNVSQLLAWADNSCTSNVELFAMGNTPLNGILRDMKRYLQGTWTAPDSSVSFSTPLTANDRPCRSVNVILQTDGDETCDTQADAVAAAQDLFVNGVTVGGTNFKVRTHVINFAGGTKANTDAIASAGGTTTSYLANNEAELSSALANIISGAIKPEVCDNTDNNCNGCTDEGYSHYCNRRTDCCTLARATCLSQ
ncbi:MAG: hypothetical protein IT377_09150, partial [Polyangiaceae bacterium]|nr:hypothetical protein [Polyangiaceae bacterium]